MTYKERSNTVSLISNILLLGFYLTNVLQLNENGGFNLARVFSLWGTTIILAIIVTIVANILTFIAFHIISIVATNEEESEFVDERDKLIGLKGTRNAYVILGLGVFISMATLGLNMSPLVMFNLLIFSGFAAEIIGDLSRLYLYRRGV